MTLTQPRVSTPSVDVPHIYLRGGWWRVTRLESRNISTIRRFNLAHQFVTRLNKPTRTTPS